MKRYSEADKTWLVEEWEASGKNNIRDTQRN
jgi:hypothetical protein